MRWLRRALVGLAVVVLATAAAVWVVVRDEVRALRAIAAETEPVAPLVAAAIVAMESPGWDEPVPWSFRALLPVSREMRHCGPLASLAFALVRSVSPQPRRMVRWHLEGAVTSYVVSRVFTREALLRIYAHQVYMGRAGGRPVQGVDAAGRTYFGKASSELTLAEAATMAAIIRSPHAASPIRDPQRALEQRNKVLERMLRCGSIDGQQYRNALAEPLRTITAHHM